MAKNALKVINKEKLDILVSIENKYSQPDNKLIVQRIQIDLVEV